MKGGKSRNTKLTAGSTNVGQGPLHQRYHNLAAAIKYNTNRNQSSNFANYTYDASILDKRNPQSLNMMNMTFHNSQFKADYVTLTQLKSEEPLNQDGLIIGSIYWTKNFILDDESRYINPKMEEELRQFKDKITARFKNGQIPKDFKFPRITDQPINDQSGTSYNNAINPEMLIFSPQAQYFKSNKNQTSRNLERKLMSQTFFANEKNIKNANLTKRNPTTGQSTTQEQNLYPENISSRKHALAKSEVFTQQETRQPQSHTIPIINQSPVAAKLQLRDTTESSQGGSDDLDDSQMVEIIKRPTLQMANKTNNINHTKNNKQQNQSLHLRYARKNQEYSTAQQNNEMSNDSKNIIITQLIQNIINNNASSQSNSQQRGQSSTKNRSRTNNYLNPINMAQTFQREQDSTRNGEEKSEKIQSLTQKFSHIIRRRKQFQDILSKNGGELSVNQTQVLKGSTKRQKTIDFNAGGPLQRLGDTLISPLANQSANGVNLLLESNHAHKLTDSSVKLGGLAQNQLSEQQNSRNGTRKLQFASTTNRQRSINQSAVANVQRNRQKYVGVTNNYAMKDLLSPTMAGTQVGNTSRNAPIMSFKSNIAPNDPPLSQMVISPYAQIQKQSSRGVYFNKELKRFIFPSMHMSSSKE